MPVPARPLQALQEEKAIYAEVRKQVEEYQEQHQKLRAEAEAAAKAEAEKKMKKEKHDATLSMIDSLAKATLNKEIKGDEPAAADSGTPKK